MLEVHGALRGDAREDEEEAARWMIGRAGVRSAIKGLSCHAQQEETLRRWDRVAQKGVV